MYDVCVYDVCVCMSVHGMYVYLCMCVQVYVLVCGWWWWGGGGGGGHSTGSQHEEDAVEGGATQPDTLPLCLLFLLPQMSRRFCIQ